MGRTKSTPKKSLSASTASTFKEHDPGCSFVQMSSLWALVQAATLEANSAPSSRSSHSAPSAPSSHSPTRSSRHKLQHPLVLAGVVSLLSPMQEAITQVLLSSDDGVCHVDFLVQQIEKQWNDGLHMKSNGTHYKATCRKAVLTALRYYAQGCGPALFVNAHDSRKHWKVVATLKESEAVKKANNARKRKGAKMPFKRFRKEESDNNKKAKNVKSAGSGSSMSCSSSASSSNEGKLVYDDYFQAREKEKSEQLTTLQRLLSFAIIENAGSASLDDIMEYASKHWHLIRSRNGMPKNTDRKRAILACLSKNMYTYPLFSRGANKTDWVLGKHNPLKKQDMCPDTLRSMPLIISPSRPLMSDLHELISATIVQNGGEATLSQIKKSVQKKWTSLRRRDGTPYSSNMERAVQASLNSQTGEALFERFDAGSELVFSLSQRGRDLYSQITTPAVIALSYLPSVPSSASASDPSSSSSDSSASDSEISSTSFFHRSSVPESPPSVEVAGPTFAAPAPSPITHNKPLPRRRRSFPRFKQHHHRPDGHRRPTVNKLLANHHTDTRRNGFLMHGEKRQKLSDPFAPLSGPTPMLLSPSALQPPQSPPSSPLHIPSHAPFFQSFPSHLPPTPNRNDMMLGTPLFRSNAFARPMTTLIDV